MAGVKRTTDTTDVNKEPCLLDMVSRLIGAHGLVGVLQAIAACCEQRAILYAQSSSRSERDSRPAWVKSGRMVDELATKVKWL